MGRLVAILAALVILAVFIALNLPYRTTVDVFGWKLEDAPSVIVIIASVALGIVLSIAVYVVSHVGRRRRNTLRTRVAAAEDRARELTEQGKAQARMDDPGAAEPRAVGKAGSQHAPGSDRASAEIVRRPGFRERLHRFFGR